VREQELTDGSVKRTSTPVHRRLQCWMKVLSNQYPGLAKVAATNLSKHSISCAFEINLSVFDRLCDKLRSCLHLSRAEKLVFLAANDRIRKGQLDATSGDVLFNDSDVEGDSNIEVVGVMEQLLATGAAPSCSTQPGDNGDDVL
jgi:hypothetical protein